MTSRRRSRPSSRSCASISNGSAFCPHFLACVREHRTALTPTLCLSSGFLSLRKIDAADVDAIAGVCDRILDEFVVPPGVLPEDGPIFAPVKSSVRLIADSDEAILRYSKMLLAEWFILLVKNNQKDFVSHTIELPCLLVDRCGR